MQFSLIKKVMDLFYSKSPELHLSRFFLAVWLERSHSPHPPERFWASAMAVPALRRGVFHTKMTGVTRSNFVRGITVEAMRLNTPLKESDVWHSWLVMVGEE